MSGIIINEDFENFMASYPAEKMTEAGLKEQIDHYAIGQTHDLVFCGNGMRAMFDSQAFEPIWKGLKDTANGKVYFRGREIFDTPLPVKRNAINSRLLHQQVGNPFQTRIDYGRHRGLKVWMSMRMNDIHWVSDIDFLMHSDFWRNNQQLWRAPYQKAWSGRALDYGKEEVRDYSMNLVREYLCRFDLDGLELDWMRTPPHFRPGYEEEGKLLLNDFMRQIRQFADEAEKRNGHPLKIGVRVLPRPEDTLRSGLDFFTWTKEKLVEQIVVTGYCGSTDYDMPLEIWRELLPSEITLAAGVELVARPFPESEGFYNTAEIIAGYAASFFYRGADCIYLFNHMDGLVGMKDKTTFRKVLENIGEQSTAEAMSRRHIVTYTDVRAEGIKCESRLPMVLQNEMDQAVRLNVGGKTQGRDALIILGIDSEKSIFVSAIELRLNSVLCQCETVTPDLEVPSTVKKLLAFSICDGQIHNGDNVIEIVYKSKDPITICWVEIYVV